MVAQLVTAVALLLARCHPTRIADAAFDCRLRQLARDYTRDVVLAPSQHWSAERAAGALSLVSEGLLLSECNISSAGPPQAPAVEPQLRVPGGSNMIFVAPAGSDANAGTESSPLQSIAGAQALIRKRYPSVASRPAITVAIGAGDYHFGSAGPQHLAQATSYSHTAIATFTEHDSGGSAEAPITYTSAPGATSRPRLIGGVPITGLNWEPAAPSSGLPPGVMQASIPDGSVAFDVQDQLFFKDGATDEHIPLVRGRTPSGKPWIPMDGFNLTVVGGWDYLNKSSPQNRVLPSPPMYSNCALNKPNSSNSCKPATVVCDETNATQVHGPVGMHTPTGPGGEIHVKECLAHLLDIGFDFPEWQVGSSLTGPGGGAADYGVIGGSCDLTNAASACVQKLDTTYNFPLWFGPWAASIDINVTADAGSGVDLADYKWPDASDVVVHAMADGEWGGCQFRVKKRSYKLGTATIDDGRTEAEPEPEPEVAAEAEAAAANPVLHFSHGGFQQARGARLGPGWGSYPGHPDGRSGNRYYMEGSIEFLDREGEWHFDATTRLLSLFPPSGSSMRGSELLLTQTDTLLQLLGSDITPGSRVQHLVFSNLSFSHTSAQFFRPHEETSGGDYSTHRSGAVKLENATGVQLLANNFEWIGGNAVLLSNSVRNSSVTANRFRWLGTSGVAVQGKTGAAMMDGRDGEAMAAVHGGAMDNGVRLPMDNTISHNVFADIGIWDKQSACFHKALAPNNTFLNNVCFNTSRHAVNFQDGFGGGGVAEGNVVFNLNRETSDTTAFNSWNRRNYLSSDPADPVIAVLVPPTLNQWRRNLILGRDYYMFRDGNGNGLRNDDGASYYNHSLNILYLAGLEFNGGTQIHAVGNLFINSIWSLSRTPDVCSAFNNTFVLSAGGGSRPQRISAGGNGCELFWNTSWIHQPDGAPVMPAIYTGDFDLGIVNASGELPPDATIDWSKYYCGYSLREWQRATKQDAHSRHVVSMGPHGEWGSAALLAQARELLYAGQ